MSPEVIFKILTTGTAQVLTSQNEHWLWTIYLAILVQTGWTLALPVSLPLPDLNWTWSHVSFLKLSPTYLLQSHSGQSLILPSLSISSRFSFTKSQETVRQYRIFLGGVRAKKLSKNPEAFREQSETRNWVHRLTTNFYLATYGSNDGQGPWH